MTDWRVTNYIYCQKRGQQIHLKACEANEAKCKKRKTCTAYKEKIQPDAHQPDPKRLEEVVAPLKRKGVYDKTGRLHLPKMPKKAVPGKGEGVLRRGSPQTRHRELGRGDHVDTPEHPVSTGVLGNTLQRVS